MNSRRSRKRASTEEPYLAKVDYKKVIHLCIGWRTEYQLDFVTQNPASPVSKKLGRQSITGKNTVITILLSSEVSRSKFEIDTLDWIYSHDEEGSLLVLYYDGITDEGLFLKPPSAFAGKKIQ